MRDAALLIGGSHGRRWQREIHTCVCVCGREGGREGGGEKRGAFIIHNHSFTRREQEQEEKETVGG